MTLPKPIAVIWRWLEHVHTAYWLVTVIVESSMIGTAITWGASVWNQVPLFLAMVYGLFGTACVMLIAIAVKDVTTPRVSVPPKPISSSMVSDLPALAPVDKSKIRMQRYAAPADAKELDVKTVTNKELGELITSLANTTRNILSNYQYSSRADKIEAFNSKVSPYFLWAYEEARNRGHQDSDLEKYFEDISATDVYKAEEKLRLLGSRMHLYLDG